MSETPTTDSLLWNVARASPTYDGLIGRNFPHRTDFRSFLSYYIDCLDNSGTHRSLMIYDKVGNAGGFDKSSGAERVAVTMTTLC